MNPENKQRIVGIVVLVAFVALLIPFLFTSGVKKKDQAAASSNESTPVQVANTTSQITSEAVQQPIVSQSEALPKEQVENQNLPVEITASESTASPVSETENADIKIQTSVATATTGTPIATSDELKPAVVEEAKPEIATKIQKTVIVKDKKSKTVLKKNKAKNISKSKMMLWSVQVGSFSDQARMQKMVTNIQTKGFQVYLQKITTSKGLMVRVLVGHETDKAKALRIAQRLKTKLNIDGRVVENKK